MTAVLAIDGGRTGAAVLLALDPSHPADAPTWAVDLLASFAWRTRGKTAPYYQLSWETSEGVGVRTTYTPYGLGAAVRSALVDAGWRRHRVVVEDAYVGRNPRTAVVGARWSAQFAAALEGAATSDRPILGGAAEWVLPDEWRAGALGIRRATPREQAKALTAARLPACLVERMAPLAAELGDAEHLHDALGIGLWALGVQVVAPEPPKRKRKTKKEAP